MSTTVGLAKHILDEYTAPELGKLYSCSLAEPKELACVNADLDLVVYGNQEMMITLHSGTISRLRDLIIFGKLTIKTDTEDGPRGRIEVRNIILTGNLACKRIELITRFCTVFHDHTSFQEELSERLKQSPP